MEKQTSSESGALQELLDSTAFRKAPALRSLVEYLWLHRNEELNEFRIATEALSRRDDFNPKTDAAVRVQLMRVRQKIKEYYSDEGKDAAERISLPPSSHRLQLIAMPPVESPTPRRPARQLVPWGIAVICALIAIASFVLRAPHSGAVAAGAGSAPLPDFWRRFTANGKPVRLILPNIAFFRWPHNSIKARDTRINRFDQLPLSPELTAMARQWGTPEIMVNYTSAPDALAASEIAILLSKHGITASVAGARDAALDTPEAFNQILLGNGRTGEHILPYLAGLNFEPTENFGFRNRSPKPGEPAHYGRVEESRRREMVPGLICERPATAGRARVLTLLSENNPSLAQLLVTPAGLSDLTAALRSAGASDGFEALAIAEIETARVVRVKPAAVRRISASP